MSATTSDDLLVVSRDGDALFATINLRPGDDGAILGRALVLAIVEVAGAFQNSETAFLHFLCLALGQAYHYGEDFMAAGGQTH